MNPARVAVEGTPRTDVSSEPGRPLWRRLGFAIMWLAAVAAIPLLSIVGLRSVLGAQLSAPERRQVDPSAPGFQALVTPTPTLLVLHEGPDGSLASIAVVVPAGQGSGGGVMLIPVTAQVVEGAETRTLAELHADRSDATERGVEALLGVSIAQTQTIDSIGWSEIASPVSPLVIDSPDHLEVTDSAGSSVVFEASQLSLPADQIGLYLAASRPGENPQAQLFRQELVWTALLDAVAAAGEAGLSTSAGGALGGVVHDVAADVHNVTVMAGEPVLVPAGTPGVGETYQGFHALPNELHDQILSLVQFPVAAPGDNRWARVRLLDGHGNQPATLSAGRILIGEWAQLTVFGNADSFDHDTSLVIYHDEAFRDHGQRLAEALDHVEVVFGEESTDAIDLTVIIGSDFEPDSSTLEPLLPRIIATVPDRGTDE